MKSYGQFCPVAQTMEILGERWTLLVVRELLEGSHRFNDLLRGVPLMSRTMLSQRLRTLEDAGVLRRVERDTGRGSDYYLTEAGEEIRPLVIQAGVWGQRWARRTPDREHLDAGLLMWDMRRNINLDSVPKGRTTVEFSFDGAAAGQRYFWLLLQPLDVDVCLSHPGCDVDLKVQTHLLTMTQVWMGDVGLADALEKQQLKLEGPRDLVKAFPKWLALSGFASVERPTD